MKFDICDRYYNMHIKKDNIWKTAFLTNRGLYESVVMSFGLCNTPSTFQAMTNTIFYDFIEEGWLTVYMNDLIIATLATESLTEHWQKVHKVLTRLEQHDLYLRPSKCEFEQDSTSFLGIIVSHNTT